MRNHGGLGSKRVEVVTAPAQFLRVVRRHEGEVSEDVQIRLVSCGEGGRAGRSAGRAGALARAFFACFRRRAPSHAPNAYLWNK